MCSLNVLFFAFGNYKLRIWHMFISSSSNWLAPMNGIPYPTWPISPNAPPMSASSWTFGSYTPWAPPTSAPQPSLAFGSQASSAWGTYTPGGTWSSESTAASWGAQTPAAYSPWIPPQQQQQEGTWFTPNMLKPPVSPYDPSAVQPILWPGDGAVGHSGYPEGWENGSKPSTLKKTHSKKRHNSTHNDFPKRPPLY